MNICCFVVLQKKSVGNFRRIIEFYKSAIKVNVELFDCDEFVIRRNHRPIVFTDKKLLTLFDCFSSRFEIQSLFLSRNYSNSTRPTTKFRLVNRGQVIQLLSTLFVIRVLFRNLFLALFIGQDFDIDRRHSLKFRSVFEKKFGKSGFSIFGLIVERDVDVL